MNPDDPYLVSTKSGRFAATPEPNRVSYTPSDITDLVTANAEIDRLRHALAAADARERTLSDELQHRVRNMLAMIRSVVRQTWEDGASQDEYAQHLQGRLDAIARYQSRLDLGSTSGLDIEDVIRDELLPTLCLDSQRCEIDGPPVQLHDREAELFGLAIHELATNAIKFGAFAHGGSVRAAWSIEGARLLFRWSETGVAIAAAAPRPSGFGRRLILDALPYQLGATTSFDLAPGGVVCTIDMALVEATAAASSRPDRTIGGFPPSLDQTETPL